MPQIISHRDLSKDAAIIFIHGFGGDYKKTWKEFPKFLMKEKSLNSWDVFSIGYRSRLIPRKIMYWQDEPDLKILAQELETLIGTQFKDKQTLCIIAHSMGGLIAQRAIMNDDIIRDKVSSLFCFGTPSNGLEKARKVSWLQGQLKDMSKDSEFILTLRKDWNALFPSSNIKFIACAGTLDDFVPRVSSLDCFQKQHQRVVAGDHTSIVKPLSNSDTQVQLIVNEMTNPKLAIEFRSFKKRVKKWYKHHGELDDKALVDLSLALESIGKHKKALKVLSKRKTIDTDAMGVLAGRYKRRWLANRKKSDAKKSYTNYLEAYNTSVDNKDINQIFYHAINLSFLDLCFNEERSSSAKYANIALKNCKQIEIPDHWNLATQADALLIIGNHDNDVIELYREAFQSVKSYREQDSMIEQTINILNYLKNEKLFKQFRKLITECDFKEKNYA